MTTGRGRLERSAAKTAFILFLIGAFEPHAIRTAAAIDFDVQDALDFSAFSTSSREGFCCGVRASPKTEERTAAARITDLHRPNRSFARHADEDMFFMIPTDGRTEVVI